MKDKALGYLRAISVGAKEVGLARAAWSVFSSRAFRGIGPSFHSLYGFSQVPADQWGCYIGSVEANKLTRKINGKENTYLTGNKLTFFSHCQENDIRTIPIYGVLGRSQPESDIKFISSSSELAHLLSDTLPHVFFKTSRGAHGEGAFRASRSGSGWMINGSIYDASKLYDFALGLLSENSCYLIQPAIKPHEKMCSFMPSGALGTVRIMTYVHDSDAKAFLPVLRIPASGNMTDNFSLGLAGNLVAPIDIQTGELGIAKLSKRRDWPDMVDASQHPDTGQPIAGVVLPFWKETVELVLDAQRKTRQLRTLGWDVAITDEGPLIVEANTSYAVELIEVAYNRGIRQELAPVFSLLNIDNPVNG